MQKRRNYKPKSDGTPRAVDDRVARELAIIARRAAAKGIGVTKLSRLAGREAPSTWYGWLDGSSAGKMGPGFLDLDAFAGVVGLRVGVIAQDVAVDDYGNVPIPSGGGNVRDAKELMRLFRSLPKEEQDKVRFFFEEAIPNPPEPGE